MRERTETGFSLLPEGNYLLTVAEVPEKRKTQKGKYFYLFRFKTVTREGVKKISQVFMTWLAGDLLRALGCQEVSPNVFDWDREEVVGRQIVADVVHEPDNKGELRDKLKNIHPPLQEPMEPPEPAEENNGAEDIDKNVAELNF